MGSSSTKYNERGGIVITLNSTSAECGDTISGKIHISIRKAIYKSTLFLIFKGKEETHWEERIKGQNGKKTTKINEGKLLICNTSNIITRWEIGLGKGGYVLPFSYKLPVAIPGSFYFTQRSTKASIRYGFSAKLISDENEKLKGTCPIHIMQRIENFGTNINLIKQASLMSCCFSRGSCSLDVHLLQDTFNPMQIAEVMVNVNISRSKLLAKRISCKLFSSLRMKSSDNRVFFSRTRLLETSSTVYIKDMGLLAESGANLTLNLPSIKEKLEKMYSTQGKLIDCAYHIEVKAHMDGCFMCCGEKTVVVHPFYIVPNAIAVASAPEAPPDWDPQELAQVSLEYDRKYEVPTNSHTIFTEISK